MSSQLLEAPAAAPPTPGVPTAQRESELTLLAQIEADVRRQLDLAERLWAREHAGVSVDPVVRAAVFAVVCAAVRAPDVAFHGLTGAPHLASSGIAQQLGFAAAGSTALRRTTQAVDQRVLPKLDFVLAPTLNTWHSERFRVVRERSRARFVTPFKERVAHLRFLLATGPGRFASGAGAMVACVIAVSPFLTFSPAMAVLGATAQGAFRWAFPHLDDRWQLAERTIDLATKAKNFVWRRPSKAAADQIDPVDEIDSNEPQKPLRHLKVREVREIVTEMVGPLPDRSDPRRALWFDLARSIKTVARGTADDFRLLGGEGAPGAMAELLTRLQADPELLRKTNLSRFGIVSANYTAAYARERAPKAAAFTPPADDYFKSFDGPRIRNGDRPRKSDAEAIVRHMLGADHSNGPTQALGRRMVATLLTATQTPNGLRLHERSEATFVELVGDMADSTQTETMRLSNFEPALASRLARTIADRKEARREITLETKHVEMRADRAYESDLDGELDRARLFDPMTRQARIAELRDRSAARQAQRDAPGTSFSKGHSTEMQDPLTHSLVL